MALPTIAHPPNGAQIRTTLTKLVTGKAPNWQRPSGAPRPTTGVLWPRKK